MHTAHAVCTLCKNMDPQPARPNIVASWATPKKKVDPHRQSMEHPSSTGLWAGLNAADPPTATMGSPPFAPSNA